MSVTAREPSTTLGSTQTLAVPPRRHSVLVWAGVGVLWLVVCVRAVAGWVGSPTDFGPVAVEGPDQMAASSLLWLRGIEVLSVVVLLVSAWRLAVRPWLDRREVSIEALLIVGGVTGFIADSALNLYDVLFMFNAHSVNLGAWSAHLPFHQQGVPTEYGEALLWGLPMYIYFCSALASMGLAVRRWVLNRCPRTSDSLLMLMLWAGFFVFDLVVEVAIIRLSEAYAFTRTQEELTLWAGEQYQFPIYESVCVAFVAMGFAAIRLSAERSADGLSFIERGTLTLARPLRLPARTLAAIGYSAVVLIMLYHLPFNWISIGGESLAELPSYLMPGDA